MVNELDDKVFEEKSKEFLEAIIQTEEFRLYEMFINRKTPISENMVEKEKEEIKRNLPSLRKKHNLFTRIMKERGFRDYFLDKGFKRGVIERTILLLDDPFFNEKTYDSETEKLLFAFSNAFINKFDNKLFIEKAKTLSKDKNWIDQKNEHYNSAFGILIDYRLNQFIGCNLADYALKLYCVEYNNNKKG